MLHCLELVYSKKNHFKFAKKISFDTFQNGNKPNSTLTEVWHQIFDGN